MKQCKIIFLCIVILIFSFTGCGLPEEKPENPEIENENLFIQVDFLNTDLNRLQDRGGMPTRSSRPEDVTKVVINITGVNIDKPIEFNLVKINGVWKGIIGNVLNGAATISASAYDASNTLIYQTSVDITIISNQKITVSLILQPVGEAPAYDVKAPMIDRVNIAPQKVAPEGKVKLEVIAHDPEPGGPLTYVWTPQGVGNFDDRQSSKPTWTAPAEEGFYQLTTVVIDQEFLLDHFTITIEVNKKYGTGSVGITGGFSNYPVISYIVADPTRIDKGGSTQLYVDASDIDGSPLTYRWYSDLPGTFNDQTIMDPVFTVDSDVDYGPCSLSVDVSDGTLTTTATIRINIAGDPSCNLAPVIHATFQSVDNAAPDDKVFCIIEASDPEGTPVTFTWNANNGTFDIQDDTIKGDFYQSSICWTAPSTACGCPVKITATATDADGASISYDFPMMLQ